MHHGSGTGFGSGSNRKGNKKVKKINNARPTFGETMLLMTLKRPDCVKLIFGWNLLNIVWIPNGNRRRNRNQNFSKVETGTTTNHYGSTTLYGYYLIGFFKHGVGLQRP
jgi:hypothetical protein